MKKKSRSAYMKAWRAKKRAKINWDTCHICGAKDQLVILDGRPKGEIPYNELSKVKAACLSCLFKDQPLLGCNAQSPKSVTKYPQK